MLQLEIQCPLHGEIETLELPDSYKDFEGEVLCPVPVAPGGGTSTGRKGARLRIKVKDSKLISVEQAR